MKFAVTGFSVALAFEIETFDIKVTNVAPGLFKTSFYDKGTWRITPDKHIDDYDSCRWQDEFIKNNNPQGDPDKLAQFILEVANSDEPSLHLAIGQGMSDVLEAYANDIYRDAEKWRDKAEKTSFDYLRK